MNGPEPIRADAPTGIGIAFFTANGLFSDPCHWDVLGTGGADQPGDMKVGPTVDDLVTALRANTSYTSSAATPVTIDGYAGQELELQLPDDPFTTCDKDDPGRSGRPRVRVLRPGPLRPGPANRWHLSIVDVEGSPAHHGDPLVRKGTPQADLDLAQNVIETLDINP